MRGLELGGSMGRERERDGQRNKSDGRFSIDDDDKEDAIEEEEEESPLTEFVAT